MENKFKIKAEFHKATDILVHNPFEEFFYSLLHFESNDFLAPFDRFKAAEEHQTFVKEMENNDIKVHHLKDILLEGCVDENGYAVEGGALNKLKDKANECLNYYYSPDLSANEKKTFDYHKKLTLNKINPKDLVKIIIERPTNKFSMGYDKYNEEEIKSSPSFEAQGNLCYTRDQQIVTDLGVVIGKHMNNARKYENDIIKFAYNKLGINPLYEVNGNGRLEGGDYIPAGDFALIGEGLRTNKEGIDQLLENKVFDFNEIVVVMDPLKDMNQMHLDTYFNIIGENKAIILDERKTEKLRPKIRVHNKKENGSYELKQTNTNDFITYITKEKGFNLYEVEYNKEKNFSVNVLCIDNNKVIGVNGICKGYYKSMLNNGIKANLLNFPNLMMAYGGPHCLTQALKRDYNGK